MAFAGVIERPLSPDEFSIYLENEKLIPLSALATFLARIDKAARSVEGHGSVFLTLSDFAIGSNELRFRVIGPGRLKRDEIAREERMVAAAESSARSARVSAVAAVVALAIAVGPANKATHTITQKYDIQNIYVRAPDEQPHVVTRRDIERGYHRNLEQKARDEAHQRDDESRELLAAMDERRVVDLAGWFYSEPGRGDFFETMRGNHYPVHFARAREFHDSPVAARMIVHDSADGLQLEVETVLGKLADF